LNFYKCAYFKCVCCVDAIRRGIHDAIKAAEEDESSDKDSLPEDDPTKVPDTQEGSEADNDAPKHGGVGLPDIAGTSSDEGDDDAWVFDMEAPGGPARTMGGIGSRAVDFPYRPKVCNQVTFCVSWGAKEII
jgi:hypothetical protein